MSEHPTPTATGPDRGTGAGSGRESLHTLRARAVTLAADPDRWRARVRHDPARRVYEQLEVTDTYDAWLIGWSSGQGVPAHDHGRSVGALVVVDGHLTELSWSAPAHPPQARILRAGAPPVGLGAAQIHAVANLHREPATSLHLYSPPLSQMRWVDPPGAESRHRPDTPDGAAHPAWSIATVLDAARARLRRVGPQAAAAAADAGAVLVDIRPEAYRRREGALPGAVVIERNELEWRLDPASPHRLAGLADYDTPIIVVCNEGYASSLAAASLRDLGLRHATDLDGGFRAWRRAGLAVLDGAA